jgi:hypothetical protein
MIQKTEWLVVSYVHIMVDGAARKCKMGSRIAALIEDSTHQLGRFTPSTLD